MLPDSRAWPSIKSCLSWKVTETGDEMEDRRRLSKSYGEVLGETIHDGGVSRPRV